jgi:hypothetical protein
VLWFPVAAPIAVLVATIIVKLAYDAAHGLACDSLKAEVPETVAAAS